MFLRGAGGTLLALPILPSLLSAREAQAQAGGSPTSASSTSARPMAASRPRTCGRRRGADTRRCRIRHESAGGPLVAAPNGRRRAVISPVLTAKATVLTPGHRGEDEHPARARYPDVHGPQLRRGAGLLRRRQGQRPGTRARPSTSSWPIRPRSIRASPRSAAQRSHRDGQTAGAAGYRTPGVRSSGVSSSAIGGTESSQGLFDTLAGRHAELEPVAGATPATGGRPGARQLQAAAKRQQAAVAGGQGSVWTSTSTRWPSCSGGLGPTVAAGCQVPPRPAADNLGLRPMDGSPRRTCSISR